MRLLAVRQQLLLNNIRNNSANNAALVLMVNALIIWGEAYDEDFGLH
jgi:hypothetical protein